MFSITQTKALLVNYSTDMSEKNPNTYKPLKESFLHNNLKTIVASIIVIGVLFYFAYYKESENIKWCLSILLSFLAGKNTK